MKKKKAIAIVDDHNLFRKGIVKLITLGDEIGNYYILFEASNGNDMRDQLARGAIPDIILMDIDMPGMDGFASVEWLRRVFPDIKILVITMFASENSIIRMVRLGVAGYLSKDIEVEDLQKALNAIEGNGYYYSDHVANVVIQSIRQPASPMENAIDPAAQFDSMSQREKEFLKLACTDMTYSEIAERMFLSPKTIDGYRDALFNRFGVKSRVSLAMYAVKNGLVKL